MSEDPRHVPPYLRTLVAPPSVVGSALGVVMLWFSLGSSLLPRSALMQGIVSALSLAFGYAVAVLVWFAVKWVLRRFDVDVDEQRAPQWVHWAIGVAAVAVLGAMIVLWPRWQTDQGELVGVEAIGVVSGLLAVVWTVLFTALLFVIGRTIRWLVWSLDVVLERRMPVVVARAATAGLVIVVIGGLYAFIVSGGLATFANARFAGGDETTLDGVEQPSASESSGSAESLVEWEDLGSQNCRHCTKHVRIGIQH